MDTPNRQRIPVNEGFPMAEAVLVLMRDPRHTRTELPFRE